ncbi:MAG: rRNA maturation RNase YbeY [Tsuneonella troitsensis]
MTLDIEVDGWPGQTDWEELADRAREATESVAPELANSRLSASILFTVDDEVHALNREWRSKDAPTNVLSFPMLTRDELLALPLDGAPVMLGDVALAWETCSHEAVEKEISPQSHAAHLIVHGLLHLSGRDHHDALEADAMEALEIKALATMGFDDPYGTSQA